MTVHHCFQECDLLWFQESLPFRGHTSPVSKRNAIGTTLFGTGKPLEFKRMTFASKMQHQIYWGPLKGPVEWSLKTWLAPWAYIASVLYHDLYWYPRFSRKQMQACLQSEWGRLFQNWGKVPATEAGFSEVGQDEPKYRRNLSGMLKQGVKVLGSCIVEAPEFESRRRTNRKD